MLQRYKDESVFQYRVCIENGYTLNFPVTTRSCYICAAKMKNKFLPILLSILLLSACIDDELCVGKGTNIVKIKFFDFEDPATTFAVTFDSIGASGNPESFPWYSDSTLTEINLTVDPNENFTRFVLFTTERTDTLDLSYDSQTRLISPTCGPEEIFSELGVVNYTFDSLVLDESLFEKEVETNIRIYY